MEIEPEGCSYKLKKNYCRASARNPFLSFRTLNTGNGLPEDVVSSLSSQIDSFTNWLDKVWRQFKFVDVDTEIEEEKIDNDVHDVLLNDEDELD